MLDSSEQAASSGHNKHVRELKGNLNQLNNVSTFELLSQEATAAAADTDIQVASGEIFRWDKDGAA